MFSMREAWAGFNVGVWQTTTDVRDFIQKNYSEYIGDASFLSGPTERTKRLMEKLKALFEQERKAGGVLDVETNTVRTITG